MRSAKILLAAAGLALPVILAANAAASPTNNVANGGFSQGIKGWDDWFPNRTQLNVTKAKMLSIKGKQPNVEFRYDSVAQCLPIPSDETDYQVSTDILIPGGQGRSGFANIAVQSYEGGCTASQPTPIGEKFVYQPGVLHNVSFPVTPAPGATHLRVKIGVGNYWLPAGEDPNVNVEALFDNVSVVGITLAEPEGELTSR